MLIGLSITNHPYWGAPIFGNTHVMNLKWTEIPSSSPGFIWERNYEQTIRFDRNEPDGHFPLKINKKTTKKQLREFSTFFVSFLGGGNLFIFFQDPPPFFSNHLLKPSFLSSGEKSVFTGNNVGDNGWLVSPPSEFFAFLMACQWGFLTTY